MYFFAYSIKHADQDSSAVSSIGSILSDTLVVYSNQQSLARHNSEKVKAT